MSNRDGIVTALDALNTLQVSDRLYVILQALTEIGAATQSPLMQFGVTSSPDVDTHVAVVVGFFELANQLREAAGLLQGAKLSMHGHTAAGVDTVFEIRKHRVDREMGGQE